MTLARQPMARPSLSGVVFALVPALITLVGAGLIFVLQPFGQRIGAFGVVTALLGASAWGQRRSGRVMAPLPAHLPRYRRALGLTRTVVIIGGLAGWCGLIAWSAVSPGGAMPPKKEDPAAVRVLTWNILVGAETGAPWVRHDWSVRKPALRAALRAAAPDVLCVQEALDGQVKFLEGELPRHRRVGVGRDDGRSAGEYCAIYYDAARFEQLDGGTFWLEEPSDEPPGRPALGPKRICTWVRLRDRPSGQTLRIYTTHLYLTERARLPAVRSILARISSGNASDAILVAGDFNATPGAPSRRLFQEAGLVSGTEVAGEPAGRSTYQFYGIRLRSLDDLYLDPKWRLLDYRVVDVKPGNTFPSDHFGVFADLRLQGNGPDAPTR